MNKGAWWATAHAIEKSGTWLITHACTHGGFKKLQILGCSSLGRIRFLKLSSTGWRRMNKERVCFEIIAGGPKPLPWWPRSENYREDTALWARRLWSSCHSPLSPMWWVNGLSVAPFVSWNLGEFTHWKQCAGQLMLEKILLIQSFSILALLTFWGE